MILIINDFVPTVRDKALCILVTMDTKVWCLDVLVGWLGDEGILFLPVNPLITPLPCLDLLMMVTSESFQQEILMLEPFQPKFFGAFNFLVPSIIDVVSSKLAASRKFYAGSPLALQLRRR